MAEVRFESSLNSTILALNNTESFDAILTALLDHCDQALGDAEASKTVEYPVYHREVSYGNGAAVRYHHLGYVTLGYDRETTEFIVRHFTRERKELHQEWIPTDFYLGTYGYTG